MIFNVLGNLRKGAHKTRQSVSFYFSWASLRSKIEEVVDGGAGANTVYFYHLLGILKLA